MKSQYEKFINSVDLYSKEIDKFVKYAHKDDIAKLLKVLIHYIGLTNEVGEVGGKLKKAIRDNNGKLNLEELIKECGDCEWYLTILENDLGTTKTKTIKKNHQKLKKRVDEGKLKGSGDNR